MFLSALPRGTSRVLENKTRCFPWGQSILYFPIPHNALCLPPQILHKLLLRNALGNMQTSQEYFTTTVYAKFGGQTECIMDNRKIVNKRFLINGHNSHSVSNQITINIISANSSIQDLFYSSHTNKRHNRVDSSIIPSNTPRYVISKTKFN